MSYNGPKPMKSESFLTWWGCEIAGIPDSKPKKRDMDIKAFKAILKAGKLITLLLIVLTAGNKKVYSQDIEFKNSSISTGLGIGLNDGLRETGLGIVYSVGWQKSLGEKNKLRINPNMMFGGFLPIGVTDTRDQFYRMTSLGLNFHYDIITYRSLSIVTTGGGFFNYSRGLLGTGGWPEANNTSSDYFFTGYFGGNASLGLRIDPKRSKIAYKITPINIHLGNKYFILAYLMVGIDFKLMKQ
jgi:hypothetical protein